MNLNDYRDFTRIAIIDDVFGEGDAIRRALSKKGIASVFYYEGDHFEITETNSMGQRVVTVVNESAPTADIHKNIRLVFLDLNFSDAGTNVATGASTALAKLSKIIDTTSSYVLVLWSTNTTKPIADEFLLQLARQRTVSNPLIPPIKLQKSDCLDDLGNYNLDIIQEKIENSLAGIPALEVFSAGERLATNGIGTAIKSIVNGKNNDDLCKLITSLSQASGGQDVSDSERAMNALFTLNGVCDDEITKEIMGHSFSSIPIVDGLGQLEKCKLNTSLMFSIGNAGPGNIYKTDETIIDIDKLISRPGADNIKRIAIDITPLCDHAQNNNLFTTLIFGLLTPVNDGVAKIKKKPDKFICKIAEDKQDFIYEDIESQIILNLRAIKTIANAEIANLTDTGLKLRPAMIIDIQHKVASYISRPGHALL